MSKVSMSSRSLVCLLVWLLMFDIGTPLLPGAYQFDLDECVEAVHTNWISLSHHAATRPPVPLPTVEVIAAPAATDAVGPIARVLWASPRPTLWRLPRMAAAESSSPDPEGP
jgi:hypothetical protein